MSACQIRPELHADEAAIRQVNRQSFGQDAEAQLVDALRAGGHVCVSLVAVVADQAIVGHILFSRNHIVRDDARIDALALAPMAVLPEYQRQGIGAALAAAGLDHCRDAGERIVVVLGHPEYYPRFGFSPEQAASLEAPFPVPKEAWMALELTPGALTGVSGRVEYPPPFADV